MIILLGSRPARSRGVCKVNSATAPAQAGAKAGRPSRRPERRESDLGMSLNLESCIPRSRFVCSRWVTTTERSWREERKERERPRTRVRHGRLSLSSSFSHSASSSPCTSRRERFSKHTSLPTRNTLWRPHPARSALLVLLRPPLCIVREHHPATGRPACPPRRFPMCARASG
jgi:hypothetical protein